MKATRFVCASLLTLLAVASEAASPAARIDAEIARLEKVLEATQPADLPKEMADLFGVHRAALERAKRATSPAYRLYRLRDPFTGIETLAFVAKHKEARNSVEDFRKLWDSQRARFEAEPPIPRGTLLQRGLIESATTRAERLDRASLPYSKASEPWSGVYYLGEAEANLRFREFVGSIAGKSSEKTPPRATVEARLAELEAQTVAFFANDITNQQLIAPSVRLKEARELLDAGRVDGATLLAVEARAALSRRGGPVGTYPVAAARSASIAAMLAGWAGDEEPPMSDKLRSEVVPFYGALFGSAPPAKETKPAQVTVTLVRWPYT